jgi:hypothetical protein
LHSYWFDLALTWHLTESVKKFNGIWCQGSICNYYLPQGPLINFLNHREWKIIMTYHMDQIKVPKLFQGQNDRENCSSQCWSTKRYSIEVTYAIRLRKVRRNSVIKTKKKSLNFGFFRCCEIQTFCSVEQKIIQ